jgi:Zn-dependent peptidase ImmA (M78 family)
LGEKTRSGSKMSMFNSRSIRFKVDWIEAIDDVQYQTLASISLLVDDTPVWPISGEDTSEFQWFADELLSHLTECWKPLVLRQTYPISIQPTRPSFLAAEAEKRWSSLSDAKVKFEEQAITAFEDVHNLANAFGGITGLLPLWFLRDRGEMIVDTQERLLRIPFGDAVHALSNVGELIAERLAKADTSKWSKLVNGWNRRNEGDSTVFLALTIGSDRETATALIDEHVLDAPVSFFEASNDNDELRIAARMAGPIPINQIKYIIGKVRTCERRETPRLLDTQFQAFDFLESQQLENERPYVQGNELAKWLRRILNLVDDRPIDPISVLERTFGVDVRVLNFEMPALDAIAVWGSKFGPAVLLNQASARIRAFQNIWRNGVIRVNAAHELCHLIVDTTHTLTAVDILGGRMPVRIEQRARAFAAEFLLPAEEAGSIWRIYGYPLDADGLEKVLKVLCRKHNVTKSVAAWQLQNGATDFHQETISTVLDQLVPQR